MKSVIAWIWLSGILPLRAGVVPPPFSIWFLILAGSLPNAPLARLGPMLPPPPPKLWQGVQPASWMYLAAASLSNGGLPVRAAPAAPGAALPAMVRAISTAGVARPRATPAGRRD